MKRVLHISGDHPDAHSARKTEAIRNLIGGTSGFEHHVYSINRLPGLGGVELLERTGNLSTVLYRAPAYGILLETFLRRLGEWIVADVRARGLDVDLVHGHKLTIEGLATRHVAQELGCPYVCTVRGNTDQKYLRLKPDKRRTFKRVATDAVTLITVTPWIRRYLIETLGLENARTVVLPTITKIDRFLPPSDGADRFVTAFHLDAWCLKGMPKLLDAIAKLKREQLEVELDIIGGGSDEAVAGLRGQIEKRGLTSQVSLRGPVPHEQMPEALNRYAAFVLPTLRESFGMVYIEALFASVPILYSKERGIDGYFDGQDVGVRCDPRSVESIAAGLKELRAAGPRMKRSIRELQEQGGFERFRKDNVCREYGKILREACGER